MQVVVQYEDMIFYMTHFDLHHPRNFGCTTHTTPRLASYTPWVGRDGAVCTVTLHCPMGLRWRGGNCQIAEPIEMVATDRLQTNVT